jgi:hypothetical protein
MEGNAPKIPLALAKRVIRWLNIAVVAAQGISGFTRITIGSSTGPCVGHPVVASRLVDPAEPMTTLR